jgi:hypothetical protein
MTLAIDRPALVDTLLAGQGEVPPSPILAPLPEHDASLAAAPAAWLRGSIASRAGRATPTAPAFKRRRRDIGTRRFVRMAKMLTY